MYIVYNARNTRKIKNKIFILFFIIKELTSPFQWLYEEIPLEIVIHSKNYQIILMSIFFVNFGEGKRRNCDATHAQDRLQKL